MKKNHQILRVGVLAAFAFVAAGDVAAAVTDSMRGPALKDVRLEGYASEKMNALFEMRMLSKHAQRDDGPLHRPPSGRAVHALPGGR